jgi:hypothetical protein
LKIADVEPPRVFTIVQVTELPGAIRTSRQSALFCEYPDGVWFSVAVQVAPLPKRVIVKSAGVASVTRFCSLSGRPPLVHVTVTSAEDAGAFGAKFLWTERVAVVSPLR